MSEADEDSLLPGEEAAIRSGRQDDARLWRSVYDELCEFKEALLDTVATQRSRVHAEGLAEVGRDERLLRQEATRLRRRFEYWDSELRRRS